MIQNVLLIEKKYEKAFFTVQVATYACGYWLFYFPLKSCQYLKKSGDIKNLF